MTPFTPFQYLLIDLANAAGFDKELFEDRIHWAESMVRNDTLASYLDKADNKPLYYKAMLAINDARKGIPSGHLVGFDSVCSGMQMMSVLTGCIEGAKATGLVDPDHRADAYTTVTQAMNVELGGTVNVPRSNAKQAVMTSLYGSKAEPKNLFGEDTPELYAFYKAMEKVAPGAWNLLQELLATWKPWALYHSWKLPDGYDVKVKVMSKKSARIEVDELDGASFTYEYYVNEGTKSGLSNVANVVHSVDAYVLRCMHRRCNYDVNTIKVAITLISGHLSYRDRCMQDQQLPITNDKIQYYVNQYERSGMADIVIAPYINEFTVGMLSTKHMEALVLIMLSMLKHDPFPVVTVHDEFKCHPNNMNHLRQHYINIMAELAESNLLQDILSQLYGVQGTITKLSTNLPDLIRGSNYALS